MLFKSGGEVFQPQIHTEELSLASQMDKRPAVHNSVISRFKRYTTVTSFLFATGRVNGGVKANRIRKDHTDKTVHDNAYRVQKRTLRIQPAYATGGAYVGDFYDKDNQAPDMTSITTVTYTGGVTASTVTTDTLVSVPVQHDPDNRIYGDKMNPNDSFQLDNGLGTQLIILRKRLASTGDHYIYDCKAVGKPEYWHPQSFADGEVLMEGGNFFGEGSLKGHQRFWGTEWDIHYSFISRYTLAFTGSALQQQRVVWTDKTLDGANAPGNANRLWMYEAEWDADEKFAIDLELACRFAKTSMNPNFHTWFSSSGQNQLTSSYFSPESGITPPRIPDGWATAIAGTIDLSYDVNTGPTVYVIEAIMAILAGNSPVGNSGNTFLVLTDSLGMFWLDKMFKRLIGWDTSNIGNPAGHTTDVVRNISSGQAVKLGFTVKSYEYMGNEFIMMHDELMSHPGLTARNGGLAGRGDMYFLNVTPDQDGVSNFELFSKAGGRYYRKKYQNGMHSLNSEQDSSLWASSGFDGAFVHVLADLFPITYYKETCAILRGSGKYNGGALSSMTGIGNFPMIHNQ